jgi:hypothetical protein
MPVTGLIALAVASLLAGALLLVPVRLFDGPWWHWLLVIAAALAFACGLAIAMSLYLTAKA